MLRRGYVRPASVVGRTLAKEVRVGTLEQPDRASRGLRAVAGVDDDPACRQGAQPVREIPQPPGPRTAAAELPDAGFGNVPHHDVERAGADLLDEPGCGPHDARLARKRCGQCVVRPGPCESRRRMLARDERAVADLEDAAGAHVSMRQATARHARRR